VIWDRHRDSCLAVIVAHSAAFGVILSILYVQPPRASPLHTRCYRPVAACHQNIHRRAPCRCRVACQIVTYITKYTPILGFVNGLFSFRHSLFSFGATIRRQFPGGVRYPGLKLLGVGVLRPPYAAGRCHTVGHLTGGPPDARYGSVQGSRGRIATVATAAMGLRGQPRYVPK